MAIYESLFKRMFVQMASRSVERNPLTTTGGVCDLLSRTNRPLKLVVASWLIGPGLRCPGQIWQGQTDREHRQTKQSNRGSPVGPESLLVCPVVLFWNTYCEQGAAR